MSDPEETVSRSGPQAQRLRAAVIYGLAGVLSGVLFGLYGGTPMLEMISRLVLPTPDATVGWGVHLFNSAIFGVAFAEVKRLVKPTEISLPMLGLLWGVGLWIVGPVSGMPILMGNVEAVPNLAVGSLWGHLIYGAVLQAVGQPAIVFLPGADSTVATRERLAWW